MGRYDSYQAEVGRAQGSSVLFITSDGFFDLGDVQGGANGQQISGIQLMRMLMSPMTLVSYTMASAIQTVSVIPNSLGVVNMLYPSATTSCKLPVAYAGGMLLLRFDAGCAASTISILPGSNSAGSTQSVQLGYSDISCILASINGASNAWIQLVSPADSIWAVTGMGGVTTLPQRSS